MGAEATVDNLQAKLAQIGKAKEKVAQEFNEMTTNLDQAQVINAAMERKAKQFDKTIGEWKGKVDRLSFDLDVNQKETRNASSELFKVKSAYEDTVLQLEEVRRENKTMGTEIERRIAEKDEEFAMVRKNQSKALDSMQSALETEAKGKAEANRMKKKLEADAADLGLALEHAIAGNAETQTTIKKYQLQVRDAQVKVDDESQAKSGAADAKVSADRKAAAMQNTLEESRALLETADRQRRAAEQELADTNENLADLSNVNQSIAAARRKLESEFNQLTGDLDEMTNEAKFSEDKAASAMVDAARLADELRCEQELSMALEKDRKLLEAQCKDTGARADEAEVSALKGGRKAMIKMETRVRELESELDAETRRNSDVLKNLRKAERSIKELTFAGDEDKKNHERMQSLIDQLQGKVKG